MEDRFDKRFCVGYFSLRTPTEIREHFKAFINLELQRKKDKIVEKVKWVKVNYENHYNDCGENMCDICHHNIGIDKGYNEAVEDILRAIK